MIEPIFGRQKCQVKKSNGFWDIMC